MNGIVEKKQQEYREKRELSNYSIFDIETCLEEFAKRGIIWILKDLSDLSNAEKILIEHYLNEYRTNQVYDCIEEIINIQPSTEVPTAISTPSTHPSATTEKHIKKPRQILEIKDVKKFSGYKKAKELEDKIIQLCKNYPSYEVNIVDQVERSAESIKKAIAKGEQMYIGEKFNQYSIAIGSAKETTAWLQMSLGQRYISQKQYYDLDSQIVEIVKILTTNLVNVKESKGKGINLPAPYTPNVKNFNAYKQGLLLVEKVYDLTQRKGFWSERFLQGEIRKNATSCVANIAEAHQLYIPVQFRFFNNALQALEGLDSLIGTALSKGIVNKESLKDIFRLRLSVRNILTKRMANLSKKKAS